MTIAQNVLDFKGHLPLEHKIEPVPNHSRPDHLGAYVVTEVEPKGEVEVEDIPRVSNGRHKVEEVMVFPVVALQVLYCQHPAAVDQVHLELGVLCAPGAGGCCLNISQSTTKTPPHPFISQPSLIIHSALPWQQSQAL